ncbi:hypothetical protein BS47DRAFT_1286631 [Hydnum rufescens UP504]|uniref:Uncharacterized protein n=1 Tax=Hydnum rufescens UP504 TaxID=1448309 RepID=A0A9P6BB44_9AGAM|nr:hypothetical protein BS47DRAFT_1286631 [Hydnum rufescens UP504]
MSSKSIFGLAPRLNLSLEPTSSARKFHIRRLQDILQLSVQREDFARAKKAWAILARCTEVDWITIWETGLSVIGKATGQSLEEHDTSRMGNRERLDYLKIVMLRHKPGREQILQEIVLTLIASQRHQEALDELELYLPSFPFQDNPVLHTYAGLIALFLAQPAGSISGPRSQSQAREAMLIREAKSHFERALALDQENVVSLRFLDKVRQV